VNHGTIGWPWVEKDRSDHLIPTPCCVQGRQPAAQATQSHIQPGLECLQGWGIHSLLGHFTLVMPMAINSGSVVLYYSSPITQLIVQYFTAFL